MPEEQENLQPKIDITKAGDRFNEFDFGRLKTQLTLDDMNRDIMPQFLEEPLEEQITEAEDELKEIFGFLSVRVKRLFGYLRGGNLFDKFMCFLIGLALFLAVEPFSLVAAALMGSGFFALGICFFTTAYIILVVLWMDWEFWFPLVAPTWICKFFILPYEPLAALIFGVIGFLMFRSKKFEVSQNKINFENNFSQNSNMQKANPLTGGSAQPDLSARFKEEDYADMMYNSALVTDSEPLSANQEEFGNSARFLYKQKSVTSGQALSQEDFKYEQEVGEGDFILSEEDFESYQ